MPIWNRYVVLWCVKSSNSVRIYRLFLRAAISAGGGLSIPYQQGEEAVDTEHYYGLWNAAREQIARHLGHPVKLEI